MISPSPHNRDRVLRLVEHTYVLNGPKSRCSQVLWIVEVGQPPLARHKGAIESSAGLQLAEMWRTIGVYMRQHPVPQTVTVVAWHTSLFSSIIMRQSSIPPVTTTELHSITLNDVANLYSFLNAFQASLRILKLLRPRFLATPQNAIAIHPELSLIELHYLSAANNSVRLTPCTQADMR